jgi:hypothetical protein
MQKACIRVSGTPFDYAPFGRSAQDDRLSDAQDDTVDLPLITASR